LAISQHTTSDRAITYLEQVLYLSNIATMRLLTVACFAVALTTSDALLSNPLGTGKKAKTNQ
jgi:HD superfamily phosphohydrolase YqeK